MNGTQVASFAGDLGSAGFGMVEIGDTVNTNWSANFDDLVVDEPA